MASLLSPHQINAQGSSSSNGSASFNYAKALFSAEIAGDAHLYTGEEYTGFDTRIAGDPGFASPELQNCELFYNGTLYHSVPLFFDIVKQEIVINTFNQNSRIKLLNEKIKYFILAGHRFENIRIAEGNDNTIGGLFDIAYNSSASVLVKRAKRILKGLRAEDRDSFIKADEFFIRNRNSLYRVDDRKAVLQALDENNLVKTYIRKNKFGFKKNFENELIMTVTYYSTLNK